MPQVASSAGRILQLIVLFYCYPSSQVEALDITYPIGTTVYPPKGPDKVQWTYDGTDPSEVLIYLATFSGSKITNYLPCINWTTSAGSVDITMSQTAPIGQSWTWQFYDPTQTLQLGSDQIAESEHFTIEGALLPETPKKGLSAGAAAAVGVIVTLLVVIGCLAAAWYFIYLPRKRRDQRQDPALHSTPAKMFAGLHEVGGNQATGPTNNPSSSADGGGRVAPPHSSQRASSSGSGSSGRRLYRPSDGNELSADHTGAYHEVPGQYQQAQVQPPYNNELPTSPQVRLNSPQREANQLSGQQGPAIERVETRRKPVPLGREGSRTSSAAKPIFEM